MQPQDSPEDRVNDDPQEGETVFVLLEGYKLLTLQVPSTVDTSGIDGVAISSVMYAMLEGMLRSILVSQDKQEADRVPIDSPLVCGRCGTYRAFRCSLCPEQVCRWCHRPNVDHHDGKVRPRGVYSKTYIMTDLETGALIPHEELGEDADDSYYIHEPLVGPCLTCGYDGHVYRLMYRDPESAETVVSRRETRPTHHG